MLSNFLNLGNQCIVMNILAGQEKQFLDSV